MDIKFFLLGIIGAVFASMTGTGGGIVFFPAFMALGLSPQQSAATSMLIQAFGMTSGSVSWMIYFKQVPEKLQFMLIIALIAFCLSITGAFTYILFIKHMSMDIELVFRVVSILIALTLIFHYFRHQPTLEVAGLSNVDIGMLMVVAFIGGMITAITSIGVGELVAAFLMFRRYRADLAIGAAVVVSAATVFVLLPHFVMGPEGAVWKVAISAVPGAIVGGYIARYLAKLVSVRKLKLIFIGWVLVSSFL